MDWPCRIKWPVILVLKEQKMRVTFSASAWGTAFQWPLSTPRPRPIYGLTHLIGKLIDLGDRMPKENKAVWLPLLDLRGVTQTDCPPFFLKLPQLCRLCPRGRQIRRLGCSALLRVHWVHYGERSWTAEILRSSYPLCGFVIRISCYELWRRVDVIRRSREM